LARVGRVVNATGVLLHTNLGRAPLPAASVERVAEVARGYSSLEWDAGSGERARRGASVERALADLVGAQDALVVNNNAAAVLLVLSHLAAGPNADLLVVAAKAVSTVIDYQFNHLVELWTSTTEARTALFGVFYTGLNLVSLILQLALTRRLFERWGVHRTLTMLPLGLAIGLVGLLLVPGLAVAAVVALYDRSLNYSVGQAGREVLYVSVPREVRYQVKPLIDAAAFRLAQGGAGVALLLAQDIGHLPAQAYSLLALPLLGMWLWAIGRLRTVPNP